MSSSLYFYISAFLVVAVLAVQDTRPRINVIPNYISSIERSQQSEQPSEQQSVKLVPGTKLSEQIDTTYLIDQLLTRMKGIDQLDVQAADHTRIIEVPDHLGVEAFSIPTVNVDKDSDLKESYGQIEKDVVRMTPAVKTDIELAQFRESVGDLLRQAVQVLAVHGNKLKFRYLKTAKDMKYVQGWDRLANIVQCFVGSYSGSPVHIFLNLLDSKIGRLLIPENYQDWYQAKYIFLNNVHNKLQLGQGFLEHDIDRCDLKLIRNLGIGYLPPIFLRIMFRSLIARDPEDDPLRLWLKLSIRIATLKANISFTEKDCSEISLDTLMEFYGGKDSDLSWEVRQSPEMDEFAKRGEWDDYHRESLEFLKKSFPLADDDDDGMLFVDLSDCDDDDDDYVIC